MLICALANKYCFPHSWLFAASYIYDGRDLNLAQRHFNSADHRRNNLLQRHHPQPQRNLARTRLVERQRQVRPPVTRPSTYYGRRIVARIPLACTSASPSRRAAATLACIEVRSTRRNSAALAGFGCGVPTKCTSVAAARIFEAKLAALNASPITGSAPCDRLRPAWRTKRGRSANAQ